MSDYINRRAAIEAVNGLPDCPNGYSDTYDKGHIIAVLEDVPSVQTDMSGDMSGTHKPLDCISRQAVIDKTKSMFAAAKEWYGEAEDDEIKARAESCMMTNVEIKLWVDKLPSVQSQRMRGKGRWNAYYHGEENGKSMFSYSCNQCGYGAPYNFIGGVCEQKKWNFCPNCGSDMRETE